MFKIIFAYCILISNRFAITNHNTNGPHCVDSQKMKPKKEKSKKYAKMELNYGVHSMVKSGDAFVVDFT